jgi:hypothetical protein
VYARLCACCVLALQMATQSDIPFDIDEFLKKHRLGVVPPEWQILLSKSTDTTVSGPFATKTEMESVVTCLETLARFSSTKASPSLADRFELMQKDTTSFADRKKYIEKFVMPIGKSLATLVATVDNIVGLTASEEAVDNTSLEQMVEVFVAVLELSTRAITLDDQAPHNVAALTANIDFLAGVVEELHIENRDSKKVTNSVHYYVSSNGTLEQSDFSIGAQTVTAAPRPRSHTKEDVGSSSSEDSALTNESNQLALIETQLVLSGTGDSTALTREQRRAQRDEERRIRREAAVRATISFKASIGTLMSVMAVATYELLANLFYGITTASNNATVVAAVAGAGDLAVTSSADLDWKTWLVSWYTGWARKNYWVGEGVTCAVDNPITGRFGCFNFRELLGRFSYEIDIVPPPLTKIRQRAEINIAYHTASGATEVTRTLLDSEYFYWPAVVVLTISAVFVVNALVDYGRLKRREAQRAQRARILPAAPSAIGTARRLTIGI